MILTFFNIKNLVRKRKSRNFADEMDEPTALATDIGKDIPILRGKDAERFIKAMKENENIKKLPPTKKELEKQLSLSKMLLDFKEKELNELKDKIKFLEKELNGED